MEQNCDIVTAFHKAHYYRSPQTIRQLGASGGLTFVLLWTLVINDHLKFELTCIFLKIMFCLWFSLQKNVHKVVCSNKNLVKDPV